MFFSELETIRKILAFEESYSGYINNYKFCALDRQEEKVECFADIWQSSHVDARCLYPNSMGALYMPNLNISGFSPLMMLSEIKREINPHFNLFYMIRKFSILHKENLMDMHNTMKKHQEKLQTVHIIY